MSSKTHPLRVLKTELKNKVQKTDINTNNLPILVGDRMHGLKAVNSSEGANLEAGKASEEQEIMSLLATLVRAHYLEKSSKFDMAVNFEKLFKLDSLDQLKFLEELDNLKSLKQLQQMESLKELSNLKELRELTKLEELKTLEHLDKLSELRSLDKLDRLTSLQHLDKLNDLNQLDRLSNLKELYRLDAIQILNKLLEDHRSTLAPLVHLDKLPELANLKDLEKLEKLQELGKLKDLDKLDKLDRIDDAKFASRLDKLDKLSILERGTRTLVIQQFIGFGLEIVKVGLVGVALVFLLSRETGREIVTKALPAIGFGSSAQVSLGLKLLVGEMSPDQFNGVLNDIRKRIESEIDVALSPSSMLSIMRRMEIINQTMSYSFQASGINLGEEAQKLLEKKLLSLHEIALSRLDFDISTAKGRQDSAKETSLREIKLLLAQRQFPQLLEKALPLWGTNEAVNLAGIVGAANLKIKDSGTLEQILQRTPSNGVL